MGILNLKDKHFHFHEMCHIPRVRWEPGNLSDQNLELASEGDDSKRSNRKV